MDRNILVPIAQGSEELETVTILNLMRRAGFRITLAGRHEIVTMARGTKIIPDKHLDEISSYEEWDAIICPGGLKGVNALAEVDTFQEIFTEHYNSGKLTGLICAAPDLLKSFKLLTDETVLTSHPSVKNNLSKAKFEESNLVVWKNLITSPATGSAIKFSLKIIEILSNKEKATKVAEEILYEN